jgi:hypothetical protein
MGITYDIPPFLRVPRCPVKDDPTRIDAAGRVTMVRAHLVPSKRETQPRRRRKRYQSRRLSVSRGIRAWRVSAECRRRPVAGTLRRRSSQTRPFRLPESPRLQAAIISPELGSGWGRNGLIRRTGRNFEAALLTPQSLDRTEPLFGIGGIGPPLPSLLAMHGPRPPDVAFGLSGPRSRSRRARGPENWHIFYLGHWPLKVPALATTSLQVEKPNTRTRWSSA